MAFFALVHGGAHGGWCWEDLVPALEQLGHHCSAPDLPLDDPHGASDWADTVVASIPSEERDVVVVAHSLGGLCLPVVAARRPVARMVFLCAMVPVPRTSYLEVLAEENDAVKTVDIASTIRDAVEPLNAGDEVMPYEQAVAMFYGDLPEEKAWAAWRRLRGQGLTAFTEVCPIDVWPDVPSTYVLTTEDGAVSNDWSRRVARGRLGADLVELPGSHSPFYSRPFELANVLDGLRRR